jgi:protein O-GlcNAc transferase
MTASNDLDERIKSAVILHNEGKLDDAKTIYEYVIALNPKHFDALQLLGLLSFQIGEFDRSIELLLKAIEINDNFAFCHRRLGDAFERVDRLDSAVASYDRAVSLDPSDAVAYNQRGHALKPLIEKMRMSRQLKADSKIRPNRRF